MFVFVPVPECFDYCSFVVLLLFHINFRIICSSSVKNVMGNLIGISLNLSMALGGMAIYVFILIDSFRPFMLSILFE